MVVLTGAGDEAFCAGADLGGMARRGRPDSGMLDVHEGAGRAGRSCSTTCGDLGKPTVARVQGWAMAGGFGLALACDLVVASERARFGAPEINVGLWPFMITVPLVRSMPPKKALELMLTGRVVDAAEADRIGFVTRVVPHDELDAAVDELARTLAAKSPAAMKLGRDAFYAVWDMAAPRRPRPSPCHAHSDDPDRGRRRGHRRLPREAPAAVARAAEAAVHEPDGSEAR